jgi:hypothetical protein
MAHLRTDRDLARGRRAALLARTAGGSALQATYAHIEATFAPAMRHSVFKDRVAALVAGGAGHPAARSCYRRLAERYPAANLDAAIALVGRMRDAERETRAAAIRSWSHSSRPRLALMILDELGLILRLVRRHAPTRYPDLIAAVLDADAAAEITGGSGADVAAE